MKAKIQINSRNRFVIPKKINKFANQNVFSQNPTLCKPVSSAKSMFPGVAKAKKSFFVFAETQM